jgi:hypothetical protein
LYSRVIVPRIDTSHLDYRNDSFHQIDIAQAISDQLQ